MGENGLDSLVGVFPYPLSPMLFRVILSVHKNMTVYYKNMTVYYKTVTREFKEMHVEQRLKRCWSHIDVEQTGS